MYTLFNKQKRKFRKRRLQRKKRKVNVNTVEEQLKSRLNKYKSIDFTLIKYQSLCFESADKAANNVIVVCKKYYLDVVLKELESTNTYQEVHSDCSSVVSRHLKYMVQNDIFVQEQQDHFTGYQSCIRTLMVPGSSLLQINVLPNSFHRYLLLVLKPYLYIINNTVQEFIRILELIAFGS